MKNKCKVDKIKTISFTKVLCASLYALSGICFMVYTTETLPKASAEGDEDLGYGISSGNASVTVGTACTFSANVSSPHTSTISNGLSSNNMGTTILNTTCNDSGGYAVYAIGYTNEEYGNTSLAYTSLDGNTTNNDYDIVTGTATSGNTSNWAMKIDTVAGTTAATIESDTNGSFSSYHIIPDDYVKVATLNTVTDGATVSSTTGSSISTTYQAYISPTQAPGTYAGKVKYTLVHPSTAPAPKKPVYLYDKVAAMSKGTQSATDLQAEITAPTTTDPTTDTSNSGVYKYDATTFGTASDADSSYNIYYYRGILEPTADNGEYGSDGKATTYPNYVKLANNTCWRIVRTTGSGGVKMIYNGTWQGTAESGTCANNQTNAQLTTSPFNRDSFTVAGKSYTGLQYQNMHAIGYTYSNVAASTTSATTLSTLLGATGNDTTTNTNSSIIKKYIEDWYSTNMVNASSSSYTSILEESAGYCNDRSVYNKDSYAANTVLPDNTRVIPYGTYGSNTTYYYFGAYTRNFNAAQNPSLTCPRGIVDTYSTTTTSGGNGQLTHPIALLTTDELSFAGSGSFTATHGSSYNAKSYLSSGYSFWLLSPYFRYSDGTAYGFRLWLPGRLDSDYVGNAIGVRPAISLKPGTTVADGDGTATSPWTIDE